MTIVIPKGSHMAINDFTYPRNGGIVKKFKFNWTCAYNIGDQQSDWNKLFGMSWGFFPLVKQWMQHYNSSRFAWRWNRGSEKIEVCAYYYINGERFYPEIDGNPWVSLDLNKVYNFGIFPHNNVVEYIVAEDGYGLVYHQQIVQEVPSEWGFAAPIYFGGTNYSPKTILIEKL